MLLSRSRSQGGSALALGREKAVEESESCGVSRIGRADALPTPGIFGRGQSQTGRENFAEGRGDTGNIFGIAGV